MQVHVEIAAPTLFWLPGLPISNTVFTAVLSSLVLIALARLMTKNMLLVPGRLQCIGELVVEQFLTIGEQTADARRARATGSEHEGPLLSRKVPIMTHRSQNCNTSGSF